MPIPLKQTIVVEGRYDKAKLASLFDATIIETGGFALFSRSEQLDLLRRLAARDGLIVVTDSDAAGFRIRSYLKGCIPQEQLIHVYIPDVYGKERRKATPSAEGKLGVEGMPPEVILSAFRDAGVALEAAPRPSGRQITAQDLYADGLTGHPDSAEKRNRLKKRLSLPDRLSTASLIQVLNRMLTYPEYELLIQSIHGEASSPNDES